MRRHSPGLVLGAAILLAGWALRLHALGAKSLWYDELRQVEVAQQPLRAMSPRLIEHAARPLDYVITRFWLRGVGPVEGAPGRAEFWLRFPAALASVVSVAAMWPLARRATGRFKTAATKAQSPPARAQVQAAYWMPLTAMALMAAAPLGVAYGQELRPYALYLLWAVLSFYWLMRALDSGAVKAPTARAAAWAAFAAVCAAGTLTHFFFAFVLAAQAVYVAGWAVAAWIRAKHWPRAEGDAGGAAAKASPLPQTRRVWRALAGFGLGAAAGVAGLLPAARPEHLALFARQFAAALASAPVTGLLSDRGGAVALGNVVNADFLLRGLLPFFGGGDGLRLIPFVGLAGLGLARLAWRGRGRLALSVLWLVLAPALVIVYLQYRQEFFALRYVLFALPVYLLLAAEGLGTLAAGVSGAMKAPTTGAAAGAALASGAVMALGAALLVGLQWGQVRRDYAAPKDDWRRVGAFLTANVRPGDTVGAPDVQAFVRFYAPGQAGALVSANDRGPHEQALANGERFWFVWSDLTQTPIDQTRAWVEGLPGERVQLDPRIWVIFVHPGRTQAEMLREAEGFTIPPSSLP